LAENVYEGLFLLDASRYSRDPSGVAGQIDKFIEKQGGTILASRMWDERRLAYPIKGQRKGAYWLTYFRLEGTHIASLTEECQRDDNILRQLFTSVDPRIVEQLVSHATQDPTVEPVAPSEETPLGAPPEKKSEESSSEPAATA
jgi:small subunit ribosomal protein S6